MTSIRSLIDWVTGKSESIDSVTGKSESIDSVTEGYSVVDKRLNERREKILETEVVAFRGWDLESDGLEYWLSSPSLTSRWIPNQPNKAVCSEAHQWPRRSRHRSPVSKHCSCGYYGVKDQSDAMGKIIGTVEMWGHYVEHQNGWRTEYAYPKSVVGLRCDLCANVLPLREMQYVLLSDPQYREYVLFQYREYKKACEFQNREYMEHLDFNSKEYEKYLEAIPALEKKAAIRTCEEGWEPEPRSPQDCKPLYTECLEAIPALEKKAAIRTCEEGWEPEPWMREDCEPLYTSRDPIPWRGGLKNWSRVEVWDEEKLFSRTVGNGGFNLRRAGIQSFDDLNRFNDMTDSELLAIKGIGPSTLADIRLFAREPKYAVSKTVIVPYPTPPVPERRAPKAPPWPQFTKALFNQCPVFLGCNTCIAEEAPGSTPEWLLPAVQLIERIEHTYGMEVN